ncbi:unnamed protein product [Darwinula stevensoni]|uniref:Monocarboxylate transporter n=1 Tax=Darwinula stevensoni TaxID=69355 RepID=A0A7R8XI93_9CRUS|nr:unnamed protein product [Darwinula stevensoni]CAG0891087.1 unnamed protein product [Darwinula stevensoni]
MSECERAPVERMEKEDGGWAWIVLVCSCVLGMSVRSYIGTFGLLYQEPLRQMETDTTDAAWLFNLCKALQLLGGMCAGPAAAASSHRSVMTIGLFMQALGLFASAFAHSVLAHTFTFSILVGFGGGLDFVSSYLNVNRHFNKRRGFAIGMYLSSLSIGHMLMPQLIEASMHLYASQGTMILLAGIAIQMFPLVLLQSRPQLPYSREILHVQTCDSDHDRLEAALDHEPPKHEQQPMKPKKHMRNAMTSIDPWKQAAKKFFSSLDFSVMKESMWWMLTITDSVFSLVLGNMGMILPLLATDRGFPEGSGALLLTISGSTELLSRLIVPPLTDIKKIDNRYLFMFWLFTVSIVPLGFALSESFSLTAVMSSFLGLGTGAIIGMPSLLLSFHFTASRLPSAMTFKLALKSLSFFVGPVVGILRDTTGNYNLLFYVFSASSFITSGGWILYVVIGKKKRIEDQHENEGKPSS